MEAEGTTITAEVRKLVYERAEDISKDIYESIIMKFSQQTQPLLVPTPTTSMDTPVDIDISTQPTLTTSMNT